MLTYPVPLFTLAVEHAGSSNYVQGADFNIAGDSLSEGHC